MKVSDIMNNRVISISPEDSISTASRLMSRYNIGALPICTSDSKLRGIVTDRDIVTRCIACDLDPEITPVREIMTRRVAAAAPEDELSSAAGRMAGEQVRRLPVLQNGRVIGILSLGDVAKRNAFEMEAAKALAEISDNLRKL